MRLMKSLFNIEKKFTPSSEVNWTRVETLVHGPGASHSSNDINSAVFACLYAIASAYPEPPLVVKRRMRNGQTKLLPEHPLQALLDRPTPNNELSLEEMLFWLAWAKHADGNAYWLKVRSGDPLTGNVVELWPISPSQMEPYREGDDWITHYTWKRGPGDIVPVHPKNVIHFRLGIDDRNMRKGLSPLKALVRQISTDDEADAFVDTLLKNYAIPGLVVIPDGQTIIIEEDADLMASKLQTKFGNQNRGNIAVLNKNTKIQQFGFSPRDLDLSILHRIPEERISAVLGVPAIVAGLGAGLDRATYANFREAREMFTESRLIPLWRADSRKISASLREDFSASDRQVEAEFDTSNVRALQEDEDKRYTRFQVAVGKPWMTRNEARTEVGMDPIESWDEEDIEPKPETTPVPPVPEPQSENDQTTDQAEDETLEKWFNWATQSIRLSRQPVGYSAKGIDPALSGSIEGALAECHSVRDVELVFIAARSWRGYP